MREDMVINQVYKFSELSDKAKQYAIDKYYEAEDYPFLFEDIREELRNLDGYFSDIDLIYSLSWSQGDGLSFAGTFDLESWLKKEEYNHLEQYKKNALIKIAYNIHSTGNKGHYCYAAQNQIEYETDIPFSHGLPYLENLLESIVQDIKVYYVSLCKQLEKYGYSIIEYRMSFEEFSEHSDANDYEYLINGQMY